LKLTLPTAYPHDPPSIRFLDQVYHLNIGFSSGEVRMPVLEDDWSPFLSLNSIIESLDQILEQPDKEYALNEETLNLYQYDR
jgi:ubiquitin-protein ligase